MNKKIYIQKIQKKNFNLFPHRPESLPHPHHAIHKRQNQPDGMAKNIAHLHYADISVK